MNALTEAIQHGWWLLVAGAALTTVIGVGFLLVLEHFVARVVVQHLGPVHAKLDLLVRPKWSDDRLDNKFRDLDTVMGSHETAIQQIEGRHRTEDKT